MNANQTEKAHHHKVTLISLVFGVAIYFTARVGLLGERLEVFAPYYLVILLCIFGGRALLTELGVRR